MQHVSVVKKWGLADSAACECGTKKWGLADSAACECGEEVVTGRTVQHVSVAKKWGTGGQCSM